MADVIGTFDEVKDHDASNIHKKLRMAVFVAPWESAPAIASLVDSNNELVIPDAYESVGILDKENALTATPTITASEVSGYGYAQTLRRDIVSRNTALAFTMLETRRTTFEMYYGIDLSAVQATNGTGATKDEIVFDEPDRPDTQYYRVLCVGVDGDGSNTLYLADFYPRSTISDVGALAASETDPVRYAVTMGTDADPVLGTAHRQFIAGPGLTDAKVAALGFTRAA